MREALRAAYAIDARPVVSEELIEAAKYARRVTKLIAETCQIDDGDMYVLGNVSARLTAALKETSYDAHTD